MPPGIGYPTQRSLAPIYSSQSNAGSTYGRSPATQYTSMIQDPVHPGDYVSPIPFGANRKTQKAYGGYQGELARRNAHAAKVAEYEQQIKRNNLLREQASAMQSAYDANSQRYADILGGYRSLRDEAAGLYGELDRSMAARNQALNQGYQDRLQRGMAMLGPGPGAEDYMFDLPQSRVRDAGVRAALQRGSRRNDREARQQASEMQRRQQLGAYRQLSGDALQAQQSLGNQRNQLQLQRLSALTGIPEATLSFMNRRNDEYPDAAALNQVMDLVGRS